VPYFVFVWVAFSQPKEGRRLALWAGLWGFLFLRQGPIYTSLLLSALLVIVAEMSALWWVRFLLVVVAGYYAAITRFTWVFAPALWAVILTLGMARTSQDWQPALRRAIWLASGGLLGAYLSGQMAGFWATALDVAKKNLGLAASVSGASAPTNLTTGQPLIWSRLWPNPAFPPGILLGALLAVGPVMLLWLLWRRRSLWRMYSWALVVNLGILAMFFVIGMVASIKIGGGDNLHNLDMFLVGVIVFSVTLWRQGVVTRLLQSNWDVIERLALILLLIVPVAFALPAPARNIPLERKWKRALMSVQAYVRQANQRGEPVLFMDHRLLLTFGSVDAVPLIPEYEKKYMMDQAMAGNTVYFSRYYRDLADHRFGLIITEPLDVRYEDESADALENNVWVRWVAIPTRCYYSPVETFRAVRLQILVPRQKMPNCQEVLPTTP